MEIRLLGPIDVRRHEPIPLGGPRQRAILAALALRANQAVSVGYLVDAVWEEPPASPGSNIRTYVLGLRRRLGRDGESASRLVTRPPGYLLRTLPGEVDVQRFDELAGQGTTALGRGDFAAAARAFQAALGLRRGEPLEGLVVGAGLQGEIARLVERGLIVAEQHVEALLGLGRFAEAIGDLRRLVIEHPLRERLWAQLLVALHRDGRPAEALDAYQQVRRQLGEELGLEPGEELRRLHQAILTGDPIPGPASGPIAVSPVATAGRAAVIVPSAVARAPVSVASPVPAVPLASVTPSAPVVPSVPVPSSAFVPSSASVPSPATVGTSPAAAPPVGSVGGETGAARQLPMDIAEFTGRDAELRQLWQLVPADGDGSGAPGPTTICAITGMAGVGKTRLAIRYAHQLTQENRFDEIQLYVDLHGFAVDREPADPGAVLESFLRLLGVPADRIPHSTVERATLYRDRLHGRRALVVLDNAANEDQVQPLLPGSRASLVLVTSRRNLAGLDGARVVPLDVFTPGDAVTLLDRVVGEGRVPAEPAAATRVAELCGRLPLAVALAARRLRARPAWSLDDLARRLAPPDRRLDQLAAGRRSLGAAFDLSYHPLPAAQQRMFRLLSLHPGRDFTAASAAALADISPDAAERLLESLLDGHLLQQTVPGRYRLHDLMRRYARQRTEAVDSPDERRRGLHRVLLWYLHAADAAGAAVRGPDRQPWQPPPGTGFDATPTHPISFSDHRPALTWFRAARANLLSAAQLAAESGAATLARRLLTATARLPSRRRRRDDRIRHRIDHVLSGTTWPATDSTGRSISPTPRKRGAGNG